MKKNKDLILYLKTKIRELEDPKHIEDNESIMLNLIRLTADAEFDQPFGMAILRERTHHIAEVTEKSASPKWSNPIIHWSMYKKWAILTQKLTKL